MSLLKIEVVKVGQITTEMGKNKKPYQMFELIYKNKSFQDKVETKKIMSFSSVFGDLSEASPGDIFDIDREKDANGYWQWNSAGPDSGEAAPEGRPQKSAVPAYVGTGKSINASQSTYPTKEARLWTQTQIVRQTSLGMAVQMLKNEKNTLTTDDVFPVASSLEQWVTRRDAMKEILDMEDDIPQ